MKEIVIFHENHSYGGGEKMLLWVAKMLYSNGFKVRYCCLYDCEEIDLSPVPAEYLHFKFSSSYLIRNIRYFTIGTFRIVRYIRKHKVKYAMCFGFNSFYILGILQYFLRFRLLVSERGDPNKKSFSSFRKILFAHATISVFQAPGAKAFYTKNKENCSYIIPNPVKIPEEQWSEENSNDSVISVGRIDFEQKRQDLLVKSFARVIRKYPKLTLRIVGKGYDEGKLHELITSLGIEKNIECCGFKRNVNEELLKSKFFVLSSDFEGVPNALLEAMALGMPVVSTNCSPGGAAFLIEDGENGLLIPVNDEEALSNAIISMYENKIERINMAKNARESASRFSEENISKKWIGVMKRFIEEQ